MDIRQNLLDAEMILKDFISMILSESLGKNWIIESGLSPDRLKALNELRLANEEDLNPMTSEGRLVNYCNFKDLVEILEKQWSNQLEVAFGNFDINKWLAIVIGCNG